MTQYTYIPIEITDYTKSSTRKTWAKRWTTNLWAEAEIMTLSDESWRAVCRATTNEVIRLHLDWNKGTFLPMPHTHGMSSLFLSLRARAMLDLHRDDLDSALEKLVTGFRLLKIYEEPVVVSAVARYIAAYRLYILGWDFCQADGWSDGQLAKFQAAVESVRHAEFFATALTMNRILGLKGWEQIVVDPSLLYTWHSPYFGWEQVFLVKTPLWRMFTANADLAWYLQNSQQDLNLVRRAIAARSYQNFTTSPTLGSPKVPRLYYFSRELREQVEKTATRFFLAEMHREILITAIALKRFRLKHGQYPKELSELIPAYLKKHPIDWMNGKHLRYEYVSASKFRLWSVGHDGIDDGGDPTQVRPASRIIRERGRDFVWEEVSESAEVHKWIKGQETRMKAATTP